MLAIAYDASTSSVTTYVDGRAIGTCNGFTVKPSQMNTPTFMYIGRSPGTEPYLSAGLRCFRMYNRALR